MASMLKLASCTAATVVTAKVEAPAAEVESGGGAVVVTVVGGVVITGVVWDG